ncbi:MAG TPA: hypothetical protein VNW49_07305 [Puia sp.]|jgi:hypothetical protein|nr:hypothetical protein [Puia sp.]
MQRRTFIISSAVVGVAAGVTLYIKWPRDPKWEKFPLQYPFILSGFCDEETVRNIGINFRNLVPAENSKEKLLDLLTGNFQNKQISLSDHSAVANQLEMNVEEDFKNGKFLTIKGWLISETEARQAALLSLS